MTNSSTNSLNNVRIDLNATNDNTGSLKLTFREKANEQDIFDFLVGLERMSGLNPISVEVEQPDAESLHYVYLRNTSFYEFVATRQELTLQ